jgi:hypothetical protein
MCILVVLPLRRLPHSLLLAALLDPAKGLMDAQGKVHIQVKLQCACYDM